MKKKLKIVLVIGTRPEGIKLFPIYRELRKSPELFQPVVICTGQHEELAEQVFEFFNFKPDFSFEVMQKNQSLSTLTLKLIPLLTNCFFGLEPSIVLVQGDTSSAFIASLAAYYAKVRLCHMEAGLRTGCLFNPFPEEANRKMIGTLAGFHFAPTETAKQNLLSEGIKKDRIFVTGNTVIDAARMVLKHSITPDMDKLLPHGAEDQAIILVTAHRRENFGQPLKNIRLALEQIAATSKKFLIILMMHPNPNVKEAFEGIDKEGEVSNIKILPPLCYPEFLFYMTKAFLILTDSGGLVEEASILGKPVLILREVTERPESVNAGIAKIVGTRIQDIYRQVLHLYGCKKDYDQMARKLELYGDGHAAEKIVKILPELC
ncbi:UDP-N-acetylglucosamine 2-epimerase [subsurface metagenome]